DAAGRMARGSRRAHRHRCRRAAVRQDDGAGVTAARVAADRGEADVADEIEFATKPQLAAAMLRRDRTLGIPARWFTADEVCGGRDLRRQARSLGSDYAIAPSHSRSPPAALPTPKPLTSANEEVRLEYQPPTVH
ncbi:transposase, partial [Streptomyces sp. NPDC057543]|uniref:transposase n=1 Tax=Streptomyces sp. NPDC057543 TaxID=3346163 RepID=UPI003697C12F